MSNHLFPEKVLKYLWDDAFKFTRDAVFAAEYSSLERVINDFTGKRGFARFSVFKKGTFVKPTDAEVQTEETHEE